MQREVDERFYIIADYYNKRDELGKLWEEIGELENELESSTNPFGLPDLVYLTPNTYSEMADVMIVCINVAIQQGKLDKLLEQIDYKLTRQIRRIEEEEHESRG